MVSYRLDKVMDITVKKMITFITESCFPEAYRHYKCPMGCFARHPYGKSGLFKTELVIDTYVSKIAKICVLQTETFLKQLEHS